MQAVVTGVTAFVATNLDDIVVLTILFAQVNATFRPKHVLTGQYLGFLMLIAASLPGFFGGMVLPKTWIGLLGLVPIMVGVTQLLRREDKPDVQTVANELPRNLHRHPLRSAIAHLLAPQTYQVAAVTIANGGDNIGIYVPLFATSSGRGLVVILAVFLVMVGLWCGIAYYLTQHPLVARVLTRYGDAIVPFVLIGLGLFILIDNGTYRLLPFR